MALIHFLNVLEGDCNVIQHDSGRVTVIDVSNAYNRIDTEKEIAARESAERAEKFNRNYVPEGKVNYGQKKNPDNPIDYLKRLNISNIFRFVITHPDMDHLDGLKDMFDEFEVLNIWDTNNNKEIPEGNSFAGYNSDDWDFYKLIRSGNHPTAKRLTYTSETTPIDFWNEDFLKVLSPSQELINRANQTEDYNDLSYVLLFTPPKAGGGRWKIIFSGDSDDHSWDHILENFSEDVSDTDILFAPHHGRDSGRDYSFLKTVRPKFTLFGNASAKHLAYSCYPKTRITNNQAGYVIFETNPYFIRIFVKNRDFAVNFRKNETAWDPNKQAFFLCEFDGKNIR